MTMLTTPALISFLQSDSVESFRAKAYDDKQPKLDLNPGDEEQVKGTITYGTGLTKRADGTPVQLGDTITRQEDADRVRQYIREEVEPVIENLIHVPLWPSAYDAIGSVIYNFGAEEVSRWRLWRRINTGDRPENIALEWLDGTFTSAGEPMLGLYRRRVMEVLMFFNLDWRAGAAISWANSIMDVLRKMNWDGQMPKPALAIAKPEPALIPDKPLPMEAKVAETIKVLTNEGLIDFPLPEAYSLSTDDNAKTAWLNVAMQAISAKTPVPPFVDGVKAAPLAVVPAPLPEAAKAPAAVVISKKEVALPKYDPNAPVKDIKDSTTARGLVKVVSGKEIAATGAGAGAILAYTIPYSNQIASFIDKFPAETIVKAFVVLFGLMAVYGIWRAVIGGKIMEYGRENAEGPKG